MADRRGPELNIEASCFGCRYCKTKGYAVQGDSGSDVYCTHPYLTDAKSDGSKYIGDTSWNTPEWCPELEDASRRLIGELREKHPELSVSETIQRATKRLELQTPEDFKETMIAAGILGEDGKLTEKYKPRRGRGE